MKVTLAEPVDYHLTFDDQDILVNDFIGKKITLEQVKKPGFYEKLDEKSDRLAKGFEKAAKQAGIKVSVDRVGSMLGLFFTDKKVNNFDEAKTSDLKMFSAYYKGMLEKGIYLAPSQFEALFVSSAHTIEHIDRTIKTAEEVFDDLVK